ncbi:hypothetical protein LMG24238_04866 [Paraburkholderia sediminicola]|uniref:DUF4148 domain-containing protein n=1 Tax=Paraburkholderia sediminicola TaxID=458836 RepID=A0A6J5C047_9BURK|nr:hypothetical protein [Paraburkholderia sediminicola]CAB3720671.1 hypothetical protein LMG24238_04866 [Paraburkholderia sediminicola]
MLKQVVTISLATLSLCAAAETNQEFYSRNGTTMPRAIASDPRSAPYGSKRPTITEDSAAVRASQEASGNLDRRAAAEQEAIDQAKRTRDNPEIKFNIAPREMPKPVTAN